MNRPDLATLLFDATTRLEEMTRAVQAAEDDDLSAVVGALKDHEQRIRQATQGWAGPPTPQQEEAFRAWNEASERLRTAVQEKLVSLNGKFSDLRQTRGVLRAYDVLEPHHVAQRLQKKI